VALLGMEYTYLMGSIGELFGGNRERAVIDLL
jgi:hypothetical protein